MDDEAVRLTLMFGAGLVALLLVVCMPVWLAMQAGRRQREMEHAERMRALELGRPMPGEGEGWSPARIALAIGTGVPVGVFGVGWLAALTTAAPGAFIWPSAGAVGVTAIICGTILAARLPHRTEPLAVADPRAKPNVDPDLYEVPGHQHA